MTQEVLLVERVEETGRSVLYNQMPCLQSNCRLRRRLREREAKREWEIPSSSSSSSVVCLTYPSISHERGLVGGIVAVKVWLTSTSHLVEILLVLSLY